MAVQCSERICIVGAGPAGLATAHRLRNEGYLNVTVLEKKSRVGGLCLTYDYDGNAFDLGANYVTSAYTQIRKMAKEVGAELYIERKASFWNRSGQNYQSILTTARGRQSLLQFGWSCLKYLWKRHCLNSVLPSSGYGDIDQSPELLCTFSEWLEKEKLSGLTTLFEIPITLMGYGPLDKIPAPYALTYMRVKTVIDLMLYGAFPYLHRWPRRFVKGFQRFWEKVAAPLDVRTDVCIKSVVRALDNVTVVADFPHQVGDSIEYRTETLVFDWLVLACPLQRDVTDTFLDTGQKELQLFSKIKINPFCVSTYVLQSISDDSLPTPLVNITPVPERDSAKPTIITQQFADNPLVTFYTPADSSDDTIFAAVKTGVQELAQELNLELHEEPETRNDFPYFPQVTLDDFKAGWYTELEGLQGHNRTFYNGGILAFELIEPIVEYSNDLVDRYFCGPDTLRSDLHEPDASWSAEGDPGTAKALKTGFADLLQESSSELTVSGNIPDWISGGFVRNGTARWQTAQGRLNHWFDGMAMLHRLDVSNGMVKYKNRFLRSKNYRATVQHARNMYAQFGTDPKRSFWNRVEVSLDFFMQIGNNDFITVTPLGSQWISVGETPTQVAIDINSLETQGIFAFKDRLLSMWTCSHMLPDVPNQRVYSFSILALPFFSRYRFWHVDANDHTRHVYGSLKTSRPSYMHSFGLSENYIVMTEFPLKISPLQLMVSGFTGRPISRCMKWDPSIGTTTTIINKNSGEVVREVELPAMFGLHYLNTWEEDNCVVFDIAIYQDSKALYHLFFDRLFSANGGNVPYSCIMRFKIPLDGSPPALPRQVSKAAIEMPRINFARNSSSYRYAYGQSWKKPGQFYDRLVKIDTQAQNPDDNATWWGKDGYLPSEPVYIEKPGAMAEDDGALVSVVLDMNTEPPTSFLIVLDAKSFEELGRATVPHVIPFGLHGEFVPTEVA